ncbi:hypothetical protein D0Y65_030470, partial [Glycine soja]
FCDSTLRFLESLLVSKDVKSLIEVRSSLTQLLRSEVRYSLHLRKNRPRQASRSRFLRPRFSSRRRSTVQVQTAEYLKRKITERQKPNLIYTEKRCLASTSFRNGIKRQNMRKLREHQTLQQQISSELDGRYPNLRLNDQFNCDFFSVN